MSTATEAPTEREAVVPAQPVTLAHRLEYGFVRAAESVLRAIPLRSAQRLGERIAGAGYWPLRIRRAVVVRQIAGAFPGLGPDAVRRIARRSYAHLGRVSVETALLPSLGAGGVLRLFEGADGFAGIEAAHKAGRGAILITGHFGNWELAGAYVAARGVPIEAIVRRMNNPLFDRYLSASRERTGMAIIRDADAVRRTPRALRDGHAVAFVADQGVLGLASTFVPFFGRPAKTPRGAAVFALRFGAPVFFCVAVAEPTGRYRFVVTPIDIPDTGDREADSDLLVRRYTQVLEQWVRRYPEQYFWHHRRWRRQPPDTPDELKDPVQVVPPNAE